MTEQSKSQAAGAVLPVITTGWPVRTLDEVRAELCMPGQPFEIETAEIRGVSTKIWKNAPPSLPALMAAARLHGARDFLVYGEERVTFTAFHCAVAALAAALASAALVPVALALLIAASFISTFVFFSFLWTAPGFAASHSGDAAVEGSSRKPSGYFS
jgi:hypothetical protein